MILVMFLFTAIIILFSAIMAILKVEEVYSKGFEEEMLNTISSFGVDLNNPITINNFNIYFAFNRHRQGSILDENFNTLFSSKKEGLNEHDLELINNYKDSPKSYELVNDHKTDMYYFIYYIKDKGSNNIKYTIMILQDKSYISMQLKSITILYLLSITVVLIITIVISKLLASNVTKPIEMIRKKAELIASGDIEEVMLEDSQRSEHEVIRLVDSFNLMIRQIQNNLSEISNEKNKLETILLHLSDGVVAFNTNGDLIHANPAAKKMLEIENETKFEQIFEKVKVDINMEKIMYLDNWTTTEQMVKIDDMIVNIFFAAFRNEQDNLGGLVAVLHDNTKQAKLDDMRKEFVANVSHELKTPLTSIKTYTETLLDDEGDLDTESKERFLNVILTESNRMSKLVSDLLQLTKFDYKKIAWNKIYFDLPELAKQICEKHKIQSDGKNQLVECYATAEVPMVYADRDGIEQVITNLLTNAIKYTPEGGNIKVYCGYVHDDAYIKIIDNGIGIPEKDLPRVFERFYRVDKARSREMGGTGLGLPISKEIIEANGGSIDMKSTVGKGTEVVIKIPCKKEEIPENADNNIDTEEMEDSENEE